MTPPGVRVAILGATGAVGQRFIERLHGHPWFSVARLAASERSSGRPYGEACEWRLASPMPPEVADMTVEGVEPVGDVDLAFSALAAEAAAGVELAWARAGVPVFSNARCYRMADDVPLVIPEVNPDHLDLIPQQRARGFAPGGFIVTNPNCSTTFLATALAPLHRRYGIRHVVVATLQAVSGAGYPGLPALAIMGNVIPFISGEEQKIESETRRILGRSVDQHVEPASMAISAQVNRVAVVDGHTESVAFSLETEASVAEIIETLADFRGEPQHRGLPSAPASPIVIMREPDRPQPALDLDGPRAMATVVGRVRECPVMGYKMTVLGHNTVRGAAGGSILNAELAHARGLIAVRS